MLRIYDTTKRKQLDCIYLKQRLNCVLFGSDDTWEIGEADKVTGTEGDYDIDQDDVVEDYVDSDDEAASSHMRDMSEDQMGDADGPSDGESDDSEVEYKSESDDESLDQSSGTSDSEEAPEASNDEVSESKEEEGEDEEEEVIHISPKKRRRK
jgi:ribosome biogenesis protein NSA1